jgi:hypothetical protein
VQVVVAVVLQVLRQQMLRLAQQIIGVFLAVQRVLHHLLAVKVQVAVVVLLLLFKTQLDLLAVMEFQAVVAVLVISMEQLHQAKLAVLAVQV